jgi:hypothetical protein
MIDKFNFYDVYGYVLPGAVFLAILWAPYGLVNGAWPPVGNWSSALIAGAITYIIGHLLQNVATNAIPSRRTTKRNRYPSEICLDSTDFELPTEAKAKIKTLVQSQFGLDLQVDKVGDATIDRVRNSAFLLARQVLIQGKAVSYAEQFQGMYTLTRGLFSVFAIACAYWLGWAIAAVRNRYVMNGAIVLLASAILALLDILVVRERISNADTKHKVEIAYALGLLIVFLAFGYLAGIPNHLTLRNSAILAFLALCACLACFRFKGAYNNFAGRFASTVWRDYLAYNVKPEGSHNPAGEDA